MCDVEEVCEKLPVRGEIVEVCSEVKKLCTEVICSRSE